MRPTLFATLAMLAILAWGCAPKAVTVTYFSTPSGATLYQAGQAMGVTPMDMVYQLTDADMAAGQKLLMGTNVRWASGATAIVGDLVVPAKRGGVFTHTFSRPAGVAGMDTDLAIERQQQYQAAMQRQEELAQQARNAQAIQNISNILQQRNRAPRTSTSTWDGTAIHTTYW